MTATIFADGGIKKAGRCKSLSKWRAVMSRKNKGKWVVNSGRGNFIVYLERQGGVKNGSYHADFKEEIY